MDEALAKLAPVMDFSNLPQEHELYDPSRKNVTGFLKSETSILDPIRKYVGLRAKTYALLTKNNVFDSRCKGIKRAVKKTIPYESYLKCIEEKNVQYATQYSIQSKNHVNRLVRMNKISLSSYEEKRFLTCSRHSVPYNSILIDYFYANDQKCFMCEHPYLLI